MNITLNGREIGVEPGATILHAARGAGYEIPTLCHHPALVPEASCRLCLVQDLKSKKLIPACATSVVEGMQLETDNPRVHRARRLNLELILSRHPLDCMTCDKNGACELQNLAYEFGMSEWRWAPAPRPGLRDLSHPFIALDPQKCVLCHRCVRGCGEIQGRSAIGLSERGSDVFLATELERPWIESTCESCGTCISLCPTGALYEKQAIGRGRAWEFRKVTTTCPYCGVGCTIELNVKKGRVVKVTADWADGVNKGALCVKGRFGHEFIHHPDRLTKPLIREEGGFREATWDEALERVASEFANIVHTSGPDSLAVIASAKSTNEENYLMQKFARGVIGTNNVDHCARL